VQVLANANTRIQGTVSAAAEAADTSSSAFDVPQAMSDISKVAAVQQDAFTSQVANLAAAVAANPEVTNSTVTGIDTLKSVGHGIFKDSVQLSLSLCVIGSWTLRLLDSARHRGIACSQCVLAGMQHAS